MNLDLERRARRRPFLRQTAKGTSFRTTVRSPLSHDGARGPEQGTRPAPRERGPLGRLSLRGRRFDSLRSSHSQSRATTRWVPRGPRTVHGQSKSGGTRRDIYSPLPRSTKLPEEGLYGRTVRPRFPKESKKKKGFGPFGGLWVFVSVSDPKSQSAQKNKVTLRRIVSGDRGRSLRGQSATLDPDGPIDPTTFRSTSGGRVEPYRPVSRTETVVRDVRQDPLCLDFGGRTRDWDSTLFPSRSVSLPDRRGRGPGLTSICHSVTVVVCTTQVPISQFGNGHLRLPFG